ncbi:MAG: tRNA (guanine(10)-N(2))-dimethyltransferase [Candidatus Thorarchaeota archaeon]
MRYQKSKKLITKDFTKFNVFDKFIKYNIMEQKDVTLIREGSAKFYIHNIDINSIPSKGMNVFYNRRMEINRDITNLCINAYKELYHQKDLVIIDSMAASGISAIRILSECVKVKKIYINDINPEAVRLINMNLRINNLDKEANRYCLSNKDANLLFSEIASKSSEKKKKPNIISIDPFGAPNRYIDSAFKAIQTDNGLMCITATDTAVLFGVRPKACLRKYLSKPLHNEYCKELGGRILISFISQMANINNIGIIPLLTFYSGHFIRLFCLTFKNKKMISKLFDNIGYLIHCSNCGYRSTFKTILLIPKKCPVCASREDLDYAGPIWIGKLHDNYFLKNIIYLNSDIVSPNKKKIDKLLNYALEENKMPISYYNIHNLCHNLKLKSVPKINFIINEIRNLGYRASRTHFDFLSVKTDIDLTTIKNILLKLQN